MHRYSYRGTHTITKMIVKQWTCMIIKQILTVIIIKITKDNYMSATQTALLSVTSLVAAACLEPSFKVPGSFSRLSVSR